MKIDPLNHCTKFRQSLPWAIIHDLLAHPLMALTGYSCTSIKFHNYTSHKAWKRGDVQTAWKRERQER